MILLTVLMRHRTLVLVLRTSSVKGWLNVSKFSLSAMNSVQGAKPFYHTSRFDLQDRMHATTMMIIN